MPSLFATARARIAGQFEIEKALELLDRYLQLGKGSSNRTIAAVWWLKGQALEQLHNNAEAIRCYQASLESSPEFEQAKESLQKLDTGKQ